MGKYSRTWSLIKASWNILKQDKWLLLFPSLSGLCCLLVITPFLLNLFEEDDAKVPLTNDSNTEFLVYCLLAFLIYFCLHFIITFFNSAIVAYAALRIRGENATVRDGFLIALDCILLIAGWALLAATVGVILDIIEERIGRFAKLAVTTLGISWAAVSFLVIPILVIERKHAITATKESAELLKVVWGEGLLSNFYFFRLFLYLSLPGILIFVLGFVISTNAAVVVCIILSATYTVLLMIVQSSLKAIFQTALYFYARDNFVTEGFRREDLRRSFTR
jgi:hypothetical protein